MLEMFDYQLSLSDNRWIVGNIRVFDGEKVWPSHWICWFIFGVEIPARHLGAYISKQR